LRAVAGLWPAALWDEVVALAGFAANHFPPELSPDDPLRGLHGMAGALPTSVDALPHWQALAALLLTQQGEWRKRLDKRQGFPAPSSAGKDAAPLFKQQQTRMQALLAGLAAVPGLDAALFALRDLSPRYPDAQWAALEALLQVLPAAVADLRQVFAAEGAVDHLEIALSVAGALEQGAPQTGPHGRGAEAFVQSIRHLLVDEFQDTSVSQHHLLRRLTAGWHPGDGRTVFLVGDPMQSIYAFREAEVGVFLRVCAEGLGTLRPRRLQLGVNFRSARAVVEWVNATFPAVLPAQGDVAAGAVPYTPFTARDDAPSGGPVQVHVLPDAEPAAEAERVVALARAALARQPGGTVAILVRTRGHLAGIVPALRAAGLRFRALDIDPLAARPVVSDLLALTRALLHRGDRIAWLAVLRAPWCGLILADLLALVGEHPARTVWACMNDSALAAGLSADGRARLARVTQALAPSLAHRARAPLPRQVERAWLALGGALGLDDAGAENARAYLALLAELEQGGGMPTPAALEAAIAQLKAAPDPLADDSLQIMTIHHAKGLEFDTVIVPGLGRAPRHDDAPLLAWLERGAAGGGDDLLLAPIAEAGSDDDPLFRHLKSLKVEKSRHEQGRLAYVAVTRARGELHLLGHARRNAEDVLQPARGSLLETLWPSLAAAFEAGDANTDRAAHAVAGTSAPGVLLRRITAEPTFPDPPPSLLPRAGSVPAEVAPAEAVEYSWAGDVARHVGTVVHRTLQQIGRDGLAQWDAAGLAARRPALGSALRQLGLPQDALPNALQRVVTALQHALADTRGCWVLGPQQDARSELALSATLDGEIRHVKLDRTFIDEQGTRWIVDYKVGGHESTDVDAFLDREQERYREQLERYARIVGQWEPGRPIRLGLYFPLLRGWREWAAPEAPGAGAVGRAAHLK
ncbi:MAG: UvrD-helicase domain-containing protein, partial [Candidatus Lambdaproteobacteria bacterium]|nr:UvrD-helicase domain-containing protein [Candidatus Lambdaproteobacteria bacterium]